MDTGQGRKKFHDVGNLFSSCHVVSHMFLHVWKFNLREINPEPSVTDLMPAVNVVSSGESHLGFQ